MESIGANLHSSIFGVPYQDARLVLELYKMTECRTISKDFKDGFEFGYKTAHKECHDALERSVSECCGMNIAMEVVDDA